VVPPGHYSLIVSPFTNCDWSVSIIGGIPVEQPLSIGPVGLMHQIGESSQSTTLVHLRESIDLSAVYEVRDAAGPAPSGSVSLIQRGKTVRTFALTPQTVSMGLPEFHRSVTFDERADRALLGPLTARFTITRGTAQVTRSVDFTLTGVDTAGPLIITDVSVFTKVGSHYVPTHVAHLGDQTGFTVTYLRKSGGSETPTGSVSLLRQGKAVYTFPLTAITMDDGRTGFYTIIHWDAGDRALVGPLTARATVTLGATHVSKLVTFTLAR
jgi:hypothetical protein